MPPVCSHLLNKGQSQLPYQACSYGRGKAQPCKEHSLPSLPENVLSQGPHDRTRKNRARRKEENLQRGELSTLWQNFPAQVGFEHSHILGARRPSFIPCQIIHYTNFIGISNVGRILLKIYLIGIVRAFYHTLLNNFKEMIQSIYGQYMVNSKEISAKKVFLKKTVFDWILFGNSCIGRAESITGANFGEGAGAEKVTSLKEIKIQLGGGKDIVIRVL